MSGFFKGSGSVLLAVVIALTWPWSNLLKDGGYVDDAGRVVILSALTGVLIVQQTYLVLPKPVRSGVLHARRSLTESYFLKNLLKRYYEEELPNLGVSEPFPIVRVNVMLVTKKWRGVLGTYLKIHYYVCPSGVSYSPEELALKWKKKNGTGGWAWENEQLAIYDSVKEELSSPARGLTTSQRNVVGSLKSVLSVPMFHHDDFVGVLNIDSRENVTSTKFNEDSVIVLASDAAKIIQGQFDPNGVAA